MEDMKLYGCGVCGKTFTNKIPKCPSCNSQGKEHIKLVSDMGNEKECPECKSSNVKSIHQDKPEHRHFRCCECNHIFSGDSELDSRCLDCAYNYRSPECKESVKEFTYQCGIKEG